MEAKEIYHMLGKLLYALLTTHITIALVTIYLHRAQAHRALKLNAYLDIFCRVWLWLFTGQVTTQWVAVHRKHHAKCETAQDPHSPQHKGLWTVLFKGVWLYKKEAADPHTIEKYGRGCPQDGLERFVSKYSWLGLAILGLTEALLFSYDAIWIYLMQILWIPFWAAGIINGVAHYRGYRNFETHDASRNISPWGIIIGGEELHNNHHAYPSSAKLSMKKWEFDIGWGYIKALQYMGLVSEVKTAALPETAMIAKNSTGAQKNPSLLADSQVLSFFQHQHYYRKVFDKSLKASIKKEIASVLAQLNHKGIFYSKYKLYKIFQSPSYKLEHLQKDILTTMLEASDKLKVIYKIKQDLIQIWENKKLQLEEARQSLHHWRAQVPEYLKHEMNVFLKRANIFWVSATLS